MSTPSNGGRKKDSTKKPPKARKAAKKAAYKRTGKKLTEKQLDFCAQFNIDSNATQAAIRAGYSPNGARQTASKLLTNTDIQDEITRLRAIKAKNTQITAENVLNELALVGFARVADCYDERGQLLDPQKLKQAEAAGLMSVKESYNEKTGEQATEYKFHNKIAALNKLGENLGLFTQQIDIDMSGGLLVSWAGDEELETGAEPEAADDD